jgi:hypothetical protein
MTRKADDISLISSIFMLGFHCLQFALEKV